MRSVPWTWFALVFVALTFVHMGVEAWFGGGWRFLVGG